MITGETKSEIRNLIVKANLALHRSDIVRLREMLVQASKRAFALDVRDLEAGHSMPLPLEGNNVQTDLGHSAD